jgi:hypothetical protein
MLKPYQSDLLAGKAGSDANQHVKALGGAHFIFGAAKLARCLSIPARSRRDLLRTEPHSC